MKKKKSFSKSLWGGKLGVALGGRHIKQRATGSLLVLRLLFVGVAQALYTSNVSYGALPLSRQVNVLSLLIGCPLLLLLCCGFVPLILSMVARFTV